MAERGIIDGRRTIRGGRKEGRVWRELARGEAVLDSVGGQDSWRARRCTWAGSLVDSHHLRRVTNRRASPFETIAGRDLNFRSMK